MLALFTAPLLRLPFQIQQVFSHPFPSRSSSSRHSRLYLCLPIRSLPRQYYYVPGGMFSLLPLQNLPHSNLFLSTKVSAGCSLLVFSGYQPILFFPFKSVHLISISNCFIGPDLCHVDYESRDFSVQQILWRYILLSIHISFSGPLYAFVVSILK